MKKETISYILEWPVNDIKGAIRIGFTYMETMDEIVRFIYARPEIVKKIILQFPKDFRCDFIPGGVGILRTAYVKYKSLKWNEIFFCNTEQNIQLHIKLI